MKKNNLVEKHFDQVAESYDKYKKNHQFYYNNLKTLLSSYIPTNSKVIEIGCGTGDLIDSLKPSYGYGFDISAKMIDIAKTKHKHIHFSTKWPDQIFEYIFMSDVVEHLENPDETFRNISKLMNENSIFVCTMANPIWGPIFTIAENLKLKMPEGVHYRRKYEDLKKIFSENGIKIKTHDYQLLLPIKIPIITTLINKYLERPLRRFAFIEYIIATKP
jgi:hypothetical protein